MGELPVPGRLTNLDNGQGPIALAVGAGGGRLDVFLSSIISILSPSLGETARYRLNYCHKGSLNPNQLTIMKITYQVQNEIWLHFFFIRDYLISMRGVHLHKLSLIVQVRYVR